MKAADIMTSEVVTIRGSATVAEATQLMKQRNLRALIVDRRHEEDAFGIVTATDVIYKVTAYGLDPKMVKVYEIMTKPCIVVNPELQMTNQDVTEYTATVRIDYSITNDVFNTKDFIILNI